MKVSVASAAVALEKLEQEIRDSSYQCQTTYEGGGRCENLACYETTDSEVCLCFSCCFRVWESSPDDVAFNKKEGLNIEYAYVAKDGWGFETAHVEPIENCVEIVGAINELRLFLGMPVGDVLDEMNELMTMIEDQS